MIRLDALKALAEMVEAGKWDHSHTAPARIVFPYKSAAVDDFGLTALEAFQGSLDAAQEMHEAVLPGWTFVVGPAATHLWRNEDYGDPFCAPYEGKADNPARAWLLAILRVLIAQEESK